MVKQYQVVLDPTKMAAFGITQRSIIEAIQKANQETGGSVLEMAETEYMVRASGYLKTLEDFRQIPLRTNDLGVPITLEMLQRFNSVLKCVVELLNSMDKGKLLEVL